MTEPIALCGCARAPWLPVCEHQRAAYDDQPWRRVEFRQPPAHDEDERDH